MRVERERYLFDRQAIFRRQAAPVYCIVSSMADSTKLYFQLVGDDGYLEDMAKRFRRGLTIVKKNGERYYLEVEDCEPARTNDEYSGFGNTVLARLAGISLLVDPEFVSPKVNGITTQDPKTGRLQTLNPLAGKAVGKARVRGDLRVTDASGRMDERESSAEAVLSLTAKNEHLERAFYIYGMLPHTWRNLYLVLDAIKEGHGSVKKVAANCSVDESKINLFKKTADDMNAIGLEARHAFTQQRGKRSKPYRHMTIEEGRHLIRNLLMNWIEHARKNKVD